jgi:subtilase family serine protease
MKSRQALDRARQHGLAAELVAVLVALGLAVLGAGAPAALASGPRAHLAQLGAAPAGQRIGLVLPLVANEAGLERHALAITTKGSPQYGQYESVAALSRRYGAPPAARRRLLTWLRGHGATGVRIDATGLFADATMTVTLAQRLFGTRLGSFRAGRSARFVAPTGAARIPAPLRTLVNGVVGLDTRSLPTLSQTSFATSRGFVHHAAISAAVSAAQQLSTGYQQRTGTPEGCGPALAAHGFTPNQYLTAYNYGPLLSQNLSGQGERVALIEVDGFRYSDIRNFAHCFGLSVPEINGFGVGSVSKALAPGGESTLDLEVLDAAASKLKAIDVYESQARATDVLTSLTAPLQNPSVKPQVISASLGACEQAFAAAVGRPALNAVEGSLALAAASGITFLASSGDDGSASCTGQGGPLDTLAVSYPASSPWVTGVGGTNFELNAANQIIGQQVWNDTPVQLGAGGGGISQLFSRPSYQNTIVGLTHRAVPDVSMLADVAPGYVIYCSATPDCINRQNSDRWLPVGGTSAATPLLAGGVALTDEDLRRNGRQDLGLANPLLYGLGTSAQAAQVIGDVTEGSNDIGAFLPGGGGQPLGCCTATPGYDDASGLGSVNVSQFAAAATQLEPAIANVGLSLPRQRQPVAAGRLLATVSCSGACLVAAYAELTVGHGRPFRVSSAISLLRRARSKTMSLNLVGSDLAKLRSGLAARRRVAATIFAEILDPGGNLERLSAARRLVIQG